MDKNVQELIKEALKTSPRGMTVAEVAKKIGMNGQSTGRHLDVMAAAGHLDVRTFGRSKVYYLSQRIPIMAMMNLSPNIILVLDKELRIANMNQKFLDFTGVARGDVISLCIEDASFPLAFNSDITPFATKALAGTLSQIEARYERGKAKFYFRIKFIPVLFDDGEKGVSMVFEDITEHKKIEEERSFLAAIVESSEDAIIGKTLDGIVTSWNKSAERIYGYAAAEMIGQNMSIVVPPDRPNEMPDILRKIKRGEKVKQYKTERIRKDGKRVLVSISVSPIYSGDSHIVGASTIAYVVGERKPARKPSRKKH